MKNSKCIKHPVSSWIRAKWAPDTLGDPWKAKEWGLRNKNT